MNSGNICITFYNIQAREELLLLYKCCCYFVDTNIDIILYNVHTFYRKIRFKEITHAAQS